MQVFRIDIWRQATINDVTSKDWTALPSPKKTDQYVGYFTAHIIFLYGDLSHEQADQISRSLLVDPVIEAYRVSGLDDAPTFPGIDHSIEVTALPGVTDPVAENLINAVHLMGISGLEQAATGRRYLIRGTLNTAELNKLASSVFSNDVIQHYEIDTPISPSFLMETRADDTVEEIALRDADDESLMQVSAARRLSLNLEEMQAIQAYYRAEGREPADIELEMLAQTWSEHCVHKTFRATITYSGPPAGSDRHAPALKQTITGLLDTYIRRATDDVNRPWVQSAFVDNAGIIAFTDDYSLAFKVETHNHPSALEPFGGANTGVGGVVRDVLGVSAKPIANTDVLCFGPQDMADDAVPEGVLHPRRVANGVIHGVEDYGNKMGIPTVNGAVLYHKDYTANPLVYCGCLGILPTGSNPTEVHPNDLIVVIGGRTGRDGLRGATFSSMEMDQTTGDIAGSAVQIGHPINEKQTQEVILQARDEGLYNAITDCGAGGLSSAVGEMGKTTGAKVELTDVPLKYSGLQPWEIWLSEAQERMVIAVPAENWERIKAICDLHQIEVVCIGAFEPSGRLTLLYDGNTVGDISMDFLHDGIPTMKLDAAWEAPDQQGVPFSLWKMANQPGTPSADHSVAISPLQGGEKTSMASLEGVLPTNLSETGAGDMLLKLLAHPNIRSKEDIVRRYDHEVQGATAVKPLVGAAEHGPGDASVLTPIANTGGDAPRGAALSVGVCPAYGEIDPYAMAWAAVDEAMRNITAVGADPDQVALLDNFCWGNPNLPDRLGSLVRAAQGCYDAAVAYQAPFVSGKDSLNNEFTDENGEKHAIPATLLISALGIVPDVSKSVTMDLKTPGNALYVIGATFDELGGSHYALIESITGGEVPQPKPDALNTYRALHQAMQKELVQACHDCSEGGISTALAEMCIAGRIGAETSLDAVGDDLTHHAALFSESQGRLIVEVRAEDAEAFESLMAGASTAHIGAVIDVPQMVINKNGEALIDLPIEVLEQAWRGEQSITETHVQFDVRTPSNLAALGFSPPCKGEKATEWSAEGVYSTDTRNPAITHPTPVILKNEKRVAIMHARGTNRDLDTSAAVELAGGTPEIVYISELIAGQKTLLDYHMLIIPGGFSYGDDLGAGVLWAFALKQQLGESMQAFVDSGRPVLGICNGFQVLVKTGLLPGESTMRNGERIVTLTNNRSGKFECRWVYLKANPNSSNVFLRGQEGLIHCPVAHGEGRIMTKDAQAAKTLQERSLIALTYANADGSDAAYPGNPNGSVLNIAGLSNEAGNVLGLMPHPENHIYPWQHPRWSRGEVGHSGLSLFINGIRNA